MIMNQYLISVDDIVVGALSVDNLLKYKGKKIKFIKNRKFVEKAVLIQKLAENILITSRNPD